MATIPSETIGIINKFVESVKMDNIDIFKVILFGSYAKGSNNEHSDIDLAIISPDFKEGYSLEYVSKLLSKAAKRKADIQTMPFSVEEYNNPIGLIEEIINTGIELEIA